MIKLLPFTTQVQSAFSLLVVWLFTCIAGLPPSVSTAASNGTALYHGNADPDYPVTVATDTVACLYHEVIPTHQPVISWQAGFIVLEDNKIRCHKLLYPLKHAAVLNGPIQNRFLKADKKTPVQKTVIQVVLY